MIYIVSHYYPPVNNPPARRMDKLVNWLVREYGEQNVTVVTGRPNHPEGKLADGFRWRPYKCHTGRHGERVAHLYELAAPNRGFWRKTLGYLSFAASLFLYFMFRRIKRDDVVLVTVPPIFSGYAIHAVSLLRRKLPYIVDVRDLWPQTVAGMGFLREGGLPYRICLRWSAALYRRAVYRTGLTKGNLAYYRSIGLEHNCIEMPNVVDLETFRCPDEETLRRFRTKHSDWFPEGYRIVLYAGTQSVYMGLEVLVDAVKRIKQGSQPFRVLMIGYGESQPELKRCVAEYGLNDTFRFIPHMTPDSLVSAISCADYCFSSTSTASIMRICLPTKILEYLACGRFILGSHDNDFVNELVAEGLMWNVPAGDDAALARLLEKAVQSPPPDTSEQARRYIREHYSLPVFEQKWQQVFHAIRKSGNQEGENRLRTKAVPPVDRKST